MNNDQCVNNYPKKKMINAYSIYLLERCLYILQYCIKLIFVYGKFFKALYYMEFFFLVIEKGHTAAGHKLSMYLVSELTKTFF